MTREDKAEGRSKNAKETSGREQNGMSGENGKGRGEADQKELGNRDTLVLPRLPCFPCLRWVQDVFLLVSSSCVRPRACLA